MTSDGSVLRVLQQSIWKKIRKLSRTKFPVRIWCTFKLGAHHRVKVRKLNTAHQMRNIFCHEDSYLVHCSTRPCGGRRHWAYIRTQGQKMWWLPEMRCLQSKCPMSWSILGERRKSDLALFFISFSKSNPLRGCRPTSYQGPQSNVRVTNHFSCTSLPISSAVRPRWINDVLRPGKDDDVCL